MKSTLLLCGHSIVVVAVVVVVIEVVEVAVVNMTDVYIVPRNRLAFWCG